jgi:hypothetical protein
MRNVLPGVLSFFIGLAALQAQQPGISTEWDIRATLTAIATHADRMAPFLDQIQPQTWITSGAPGGYVTQAKSSRNLLQAIMLSARSLSRDPEKLSDELELLFRIRTLETMLGSLSEGIRKYNNPAIADMLTAAMSENAGNRDRLQGYVLELAKAREQEFRVADREAQRCRQSLSHDGPAQPAQEKR